MSWEKGGGYGSRGHVEGRGGSHLKAVVENQAK